MKPLIMNDIARQYEKSDRATLEKWLSAHQYPPVKKRVAWDVALFGMYWNENIGGSLTYYALHELLKSAGLTVLTVYMEEEKTLGSGGTLNFDVVKEKYVVSEPRESEQLFELRDYANSFVLTSDQLWNAEWYFDPMVHYLGCGDSSVKRIAVGTSFGRDTHQYSDTQLPIAKHLLSQFDYISVRESSGVDILKEFGIGATQILDPVFLCGDASYDHLEHRAKMHASSDFLFSYILDVEKSAAKVMTKIKNRMRLASMFTCTSFDSKNESKEMRLPQWNSYPEIGFMPDTTIADFIYNMRRAKYVVTDSFHGACFAVMFHKPFICIINRTRGNARFVFFNELGLSNRFVKHENLETAPIDEPIKWAQVDKKLNQMRQDSFTWLDNAFCRPFPRNIKPTRR